MIIWLVKFTQLMGPHELTLTTNLAIMFVGEKLSKAPMVEPKPIVHITTLWLSWQKQHIAKLLGYLWTEEARSISSSSPPSGNQGWMKDSLTDDAPHLRFRWRTRAALRSHALNVINMYVSQASQHHYGFHCGRLSSIVQCHPWVPREHRPSLINQYEGIVDQVLYSQRGRL